MVESTTSYMSYPRYIYLFESIFICLQIATHACAGTTIFNFEFCTIREEDIFPVQIGAVAVVGYFTSPDLGLGTGIDTG